MQVVFGIMLIISAAASGLLVQDPVVCRFTERNQSYVALGQQLHLQMPLEDGFNLMFTDKTNSTRLILHKKNPTHIPILSPYFPGWQFVNDTKTLILTSAERNDSGTYTLQTNDVNGNSKDSYTLQLNIEAQVSSVKVSRSCLSPGVMNVSCSADGDNLRFNWTSDVNITLPPENRNSTLILDKDHHGSVTCYVENHVSRDHNTTELQPCPEPTSPSTPSPTSPNPGTNSTVSYNTTQIQNSPTTKLFNNNPLLKYVLIALSLVFVLLIIVSITALCMYKKRHTQNNKKAPSQDGRELVYAQVTHLPMDRINTRPGMSHGQDEDVQYAEVATRATKKKQKKKEDEVQYGEIVFNTSAKNKQKVAKVQDDCVYSHVQHNR